MGDRVVEVNGVNVGLENHKQVVARIKAVEDGTKLLVVDKVCDDYHTLHEIIVTSSLPHVVIIGDNNDDELDVNMNKIGADQVTTNTNTVPSQAHRHLEMGILQTITIHDFFISRISYCQAQLQLQHQLQLS